MQLSWCIYQTRIVWEIRKLTKLLEKKMQHEKKYNLIAQARELIRNNDRALTFPLF